jgi:acyl-homoserine-lactone acylase
MLQREDSPFWDDVATPERETKPQIVAAALADSIALLETRLGRNRGQWQWGRLHAYFWETDDSKVAKLLGGWHKFAYGLVASFFNYGPVPAGGDHTTLNVATYTPGDNFDAAEIPSMRMVVDFSQEEPMRALNSSGQSGNPASPHYVDGIRAWLAGRYQPFPFRDSEMAQRYRQTRILTP